MRAIGWLVLTSVLPATAAAQNDTVFKNVEYVSGVASLKEKEKGTLIVGTTEVRLVDKKDKPYFALMISDIREVKDSSLVKIGKKSALSANGGGSISSVAGFFKKKKADTQLRLTTQQDSTAGIVIQTYEPGIAQQISSLIKQRKAGPSAASATPAAAGQPPADQAQATQPAGPAVRLLVTNPFSAAPTDSATAVEVGSVVRVEINKFVGDKLEVVTREQMNAALQQFGYPTDAVLSRDMAVMLAKTLEVPFVMTGELKKGDDGLYSVTTMLGGVNDTTGKAVTTVQKAGESLADFGLRIAETMK